MPEQRHTQAAVPQGITGQHLQQRGSPWQPTLLAFAVFAVIVLFGLSGLGGGHPHPVQSAESNGVRVSVAAPDRIRNGNFIELRISITAQRPIADANIAIDAAYLREVTVNTMIPAPEAEDGKDGRYRMSFGPLKAGETLTFKLDGQINPPLFGGTRGDIAVLDDDVVLVRMPMLMAVLP